MIDPKKKAEASHAYSGLDRVFHEKARLAIMTCLASQSAGLSFADLKRLCDLSDGNLNRHLDVLQEVAAIKLDRQGAGRNSRTTVSITTAGRHEFQRYLSELERVLKNATQAMKQPAVNQRSNRRIGLSNV